MKCSKQVNSKIVNLTDNFAKASAQKLVLLIRPNDKKLRLHRKLNHFNAVQL